MNDNNIEEGIIDTVVDKPIIAEPTVNPVTSVEPIIPIVPVTYTVQLGVYSVKATAESKLASLKASGFPDAVIV